MRVVEGAQVAVDLANLLETDALAAQLGCHAEGNEVAEAVVGVGGRGPCRRTDWAGGTSSRPSTGAAAC